MFEDLSRLKKNFEDLFFFWRTLASVSLVHDAIRILKQVYCFRNALNQSAVICRQTAKVINRQGVEHFYENII